MRIHAAFPIRISILVVFLWLPGPQPSSAETFQELARSQVPVYASRVEPKLNSFREKPDEDTLYMLRKSLRAVAAAMDTFYQAYPTERARLHRHLLLELDQVLGNLRDLDVIIEQLQGPFSDITGVQVLLESVRRTRAKKMPPVLSRIRSDYTKRILALIGFLKHAARPAGHYSNLGEYWEKPQLAVGAEASTVVKTILSYMVIDIRKHGYEPPSQELLHITRAKLRGLQSMLQLMPERDTNLVASVLTELKKTRKKLGDLHDREILLIWLSHHVPNSHPLVLAIRDDHRRLNEEARRQTSRLGSSRLLEDMVTAWPGDTNPASK